MRIRTILTDNGKEFTDRLFGLRKRAATGAHEFDTLCADLGIEHRLTPPKSPQTNGMVERFNGRIEEVLQSHHFRTGEELETTLHRYVWLYNQQLPQSALGSKTPLQVMKDWHKLKPALFRKRPYYLPGCDIYGQGKTRGQVGILGIAAATNQACAAILPNADYDTKFLFYVLQNDYSHIRALSNSGGQDNLSAELVREIRVPVVPLPEQRKIAEILRTWDEALEKLTVLRALNIRRRVWFRTHLFTGKVRLPGFTGEWREVPLSEVLHEHGSKSTGAEEVYSVSVHKGLVNQVEHLGRSFSAANTDHYNRVLPGDIVYTKSPTGDFPLGIIKQSKIDREVIVSPLYGVFTPQTYALGVILDALFESPLAARNYLHPLVQKGAKNTIAVTNSQFLEGKLRLPMDPEEQAAIADIVNASHAECAGIEAEIEALTRQKRGLMQKLLTGEWRVATAEKDSTEAAE